MKVYNVEFGYEFDGFCNAVRIAMSFVEEFNNGCHLFVHEEDAIDFAYERMNIIRDSVYCSVHRYKSIAEEDIVIKEDFTDYARFNMTIYAFIEKVEVR